MAETGAGRVLVVGGTGRLGRLLRDAWDRTGRRHLIWQHREGTLGGPQFDPLLDHAAYVAAARGAGAILNLAGRVGGTQADLADHAALAVAALEAAASAGVARVYLASSAAVYGAAADTREDTSPTPVADYGRAKLRMENAARDWVRKRRRAPSVTCLRIANVAGADQLLGAPKAAAPQILHVFPDGTGPRRSYIGPCGLAQFLDRLFAASAAGRPLPDTLNVALDGAVAMEALLDADGRVWEARPAPPGTLPSVRLDITRLTRHAGPVPPCDAAAIVADLRALRPEGP